jgi:hypothetical protein
MKIILSRRGSENRRNTLILSRNLPSSPRHGRYVKARENERGISRIGSKERDNKRLRKRRMKS